MPAGRADPSPVMPILLLCIVAFMLMGTTYLRLAASYDYSVQTRVVDRVPVQSTPPVGTFLIPIVLLVIFLQAFGLHEVGHPMAPQTILALLVSMVEKMSFPMFITLILMVLLIGLNLSSHRPQAQPRPYQYRPYSRYQY